MKKITLTALTLVVLLPMFAACSSKNTENSYPIDPDDRRRLKYGKVTGEGGLKIFGGEEDGGSSGGSGLAVNSFLWRSTLETLSFVPLASADPFGGVIITDWYENPESPGERFKVNVLILDKKLRVDALKVSVYKQKFTNGTWRDVETDKTIAHDLEDKILSRAREMRVAQTVKK